MGTGIALNINFPEPKDQREQDLYNSLKDFIYAVTNELELLGEGTSADEKVKATSGDGTADYLDGKVDDSTIEVSSNVLQIKDINTFVKLAGSQTLTGTKTMDSLTLGGDQQCDQKEMLQMVLENRTDDPGDAIAGQIWFRTDL